MDISPQLLDMALKANPMEAQEAPVRLAGPPAPNLYPYSAADLVGSESETQTPLIKKLAPLLLGQAADLISTEHLVNHGGWEANPLPLMNSSMGRIGWGALEAALLALLTHKDPEVGEPLAKVLGGMHSALASGNASQIRSLQRSLGRP